MHLARLTDKQRNYADDTVAMIIPYQIEKRIFMLPSDQEEGIMEHYIDGKTIALFTEKLTELERSSLTVSKYVRDVSAFRRLLG